MSAKPWTWPLPAQVLIAIIIGIILGTVSGLFGPLPGGIDQFLYSLVGDMFMNALRMIAVPLVMISIIIGLAELGDRPGFARLGSKTLLYYVTTSLIAVVIGLTLVNVIRPGEGSSLAPTDIAQLVAEGDQEAEKMEVIEDRTSGRGLIDSFNVLKEIVPKNIFDAMANSKMLGLIFISLLIGYFTPRLPQAHQDVLLPLWRATHAMVMKITYLVLAFLPLGVLALIAGTVSDVVANDRVSEIAGQLSWFVVTVLAALGSHMVLTMGIILLVVARVNPVKQFQAMMPALLGAFSSASSSATLPITMDNVRQRAGVSERVGSFVLPVGATVNMDGTALYECVVVVFLAQLYGIELSIGMQAVVVSLALLTSIGVAGIPSASLVAITIIIGSVNTMLPENQQLPLEALAIILIVDRVLDMCRTAVNVFGDSCGAVVVARSEGEQTKLVGS